jgi:DNA replicative helicase MCM subunit Mcm2 (Cdc46/Mcm family)
MNRLFAERFMYFLNEAAEDSMLERDAMEQSVDDGIDPTDYDINAMQPDEVGNAHGELADAISKRNVQIVNELQSWIDQIENFLAVLNSEDPNSIQSRLANAEADTVLDKMKQSQQSKIARVASDLAALHQNFLGFMAQTKNAKYKYV